jgi:hypothetical protein
MKMQWTPPPIPQVPAPCPILTSALGSACAQDTIQIAPARYEESNIEVLDFGVLIRSWDPLDPEVVAATVLDGGGEDVIHFSAHALDRASSLLGLTITGGGSGFTCRGASPSISYARPAATPTAPAPTWAPVANRTMGAGSPPRPPRPILRRRASCSEEEDDRSAHLLK